MHPLLHLGLLHLTGTDSRTFLQGQLSQDINRIAPQQMLLASCNSPQGRVQAVLRMIERDDELFLILPASLCEPVRTRLRKYVLRAKTKIETVSADWTLYSATKSDLATHNLPTPKQLNEHILQGKHSVIRWPDSMTERYLVIQAGRNDQPTQPGDDAWLLADIRAGQPQVFPETVDSFVAQMLNLDLLNGISFNKGCYTGQEIIARAHYRGAVSRRMFRFSASCASPPPGSRLVSNGTHAGEVVLSATTPSGCELLGVVHLSHHGHTLQLETQPDVALHGLELPYAVPIDLVR
jgi:tRNA-modifying protein YgfZ